jgi:hypothetical protein
VYCTQCGAQTQNRARFCHACGSSLIADASARAQNGPALPPQQEGKSVSQIASARMAVSRRENPSVSPASRLGDLASMRPDAILALALLSVIAATVVVGIAVEGNARAASYGEGAGGSLALAISSPISALPSSVVTQLLSWILIRSWLGFRMAYKATLFAYLWAGLAGTFSWEWRHWRTQK